MPSMWNHWVVRANTPQEPFKEFESARWVWTRLEEVFPDMISAVLMPNHLHLILPKNKQTHRGIRKHREVEKLSGLLGAISKHQRLRNLWQFIPPPSEIPDRFHLRRQIRYIALNPCRKALCADPLEWYWSTHRDVMGATVKKQDHAIQLAQILKESDKNFQVRFHHYVSADPSVDVTGTPPPKPAVPKVWAEKSIAEILAATAGALRGLPKDVEKQGLPRSLFIHFAYRHGWCQPSLLSQICKISPRSVHRILKQMPPLGLEAADLCLGDQRLRKQLITE